ncbi:MAG: patatin-like phospholipase family protein [Parachlamydiaceae bacterium]|nr:patatin-like phospholipase family protein [Parachlamydiaceae bacterium]
MEWPHRPGKIHVVIGDGGLKSLAAIPFLEFLYSRDVQIHSLVGCGGGALIAALVAKETPFKEIPGLISQVYNYDMISHPDYMSIFALLKVPFFSYSPTDSLLQSEKLEKTCRDILGDVEIKDLKHPLRIQVTNLQTATGCLLDEGPLAETVYASIIPYPLFSPKSINDQLYVGGAYSSTLPLISISRRPEDLIIAINILRAKERQENNFAEFFSNSLLRSFSVAQLAQRTIAVDYIAPEIYFVNLQIDGISIWDSTKTDRVLSEGKEALNMQRRALMKVIRSSEKE